MARMGAASCSPLLVTMPVAGTPGALHNHQAARTRPFSRAMMPAQFVKSNLRLAKYSACILARQHLLFLPPAGSHKSAPHVRFAVAASQRGFQDADNGKNDTECV
eukprot:scaffold158808_cov15-Prasinocladus_malaysianus.AAC.1